MPFMLLWQPGNPIDNDYTLLAEVKRPEDGEIVRKWGKNRFDVESQMEHTEDHYEVLRDENIIETEFHKQSPATRSYSQDQAKSLYLESGFTIVQVFNGFSDQSASETDEVFTILGQKIVHSSKI